VKHGTGTLTLSGSNSASGSTIVAKGVLMYTSSNSLTGSISINTGAVAAIGFPINQNVVNNLSSTSTGVLALAVSSTNALNFSTAHPGTTRLGAVGSVTYSGTLTPAGGTYRLGGAGGSLALSNTNALTGTNSVDVGAAGTAPGTVRLLAANDYTGATAITGGTLALGPSGAIPGTSAISIGTGAVFDVSDTTGFVLGSGKMISGDGAVFGQFTLGSGATLAPGSVSLFGTLSFTELVLSGVYAANISSTGEHDSIWVSGDLDLSDTSDSLDLNITGSANGPYVIATYAGGLTGTFDNANLPSGYSIDYGSGYNSQITVIPEPRFYAMFGIGLCLLLMWRRRLT
jgi:autotransporter-associated beta strand protein